MILKLKFKPTKDFKIEKLQEKLSNVIYKKLSYTEYAKIHNESFKNFSYSPLYPFVKNNQLLSSEIYNLEVRSNDRMLLKALSDEIFKDGKLEFDYNIVDIISFELKEFNLKFISKVKTLSPIVISVSDKMAEVYHIEKKAKSLYWTPNMNFELFIDILNRNMVKKFNKYSTKKYDENFKSILSYRLLKEFPIKTPYKKGFIYGSLWEFEFYQDKNAQEIVKFNYLSGMGEKSGIGFGFVKLERG